MTIYQSVSTKTTRFVHFNGVPILVLLVIILFLASLCHAQIGGSSVSPLTQPSYSVPDHPQHASQHDLRPETSLLGGSAYTYAQGERPLWEIGTDKVEPSLGDVARAARAEHAKTEHAKIVWNGNKDGVIRLRYEGQ